MSRFAQTLREISDRLNLPQPARSRVLLEISADMEDLYDHFRRKGLPESEARTRAVESFDLSDESLAALAAVHSGPARRLLDTLPAKILSRWERGLLITLLLFACALSMVLARGGRVFTDAGLLVWVVLAAAVGSLGLTLTKFYRLYLKQDHRSRSLRHGLDYLLLLGGVQIFIGFAGSWIEAIQLYGSAFEHTDAQIQPMLNWALHTTALLQIALALALLGALAWFNLAGKIGRIERDEAAILLKS